MIARILFLFIAVSMPVLAAAEITLGGRVPDLAISDKGELNLSGDEVTYSPWTYPQQPGKVNVIQYMAATRSASKLNEPFRDKMQTDLPKGQVYLSTTILNLDEAMWGTSGMVIGELTSSKQKFPHAVMVADEKGLGLTQWQLEKDSSAVIITDKDGAVLYFKQGALTDAEIESTVTLIQDAITKSAGSDTAKP